MRNARIDQIDRIDSMQGSPVEQCETPQLKLLTELTIIQGAPGGAMQNARIDIIDRIDHFKGVRGRATETSELTELTIIQGAPGGATETSELT